MTHTLLNTNDAAAYLAVSPTTLERWRSQGAGPAYVKVGPGRRARVRYCKSELDAWIAAQTRTSTSATSAPQEV